MKKVEELENLIFVKDKDLFSVESALRGYLEDDLNLTQEQIMVIHSQLQLIKRIVKVETINKCVAKVDGLRYYP